MPMRMRLQAGFSFIEVLVAMLVLGISVMAFAGLQVRALNTTGDAHLRAQAMTLASEFVERMRANRGGIDQYRLGGNYDGAENPAGAPSQWPAVSSCLSADPNNNGCSAAQMALFDINEVEFLAGRLLPDGRVRVAACPGMAGVDCVNVSWRGVDPASCNGNATQNCVAMQVVVR